MKFVFSQGPYILNIFIIVIAILGVIINNNFFKKLLCLGFLQTGVILFFILLGKVNIGGIPVLKCANFEQCESVMVDPVPQVLMLTAIVVGVATMSVGLSLIIRIKEAYGTIDERKLIKLGEDS